MAKQDDWVRLTVRIPLELHERLQGAVAAGPNSMNAEIVARLNDSFAPTLYVDDQMHPVIVDKIKAAQIEWDGLVGGIQETIRHLSDVRSTRNIIIEAAAKILGEHIESGTSTDDLVKAIQNVVKNAEVNTKDKSDN